MKPYRLLPTLLLLAMLAIDAAMVRQCTQAPSEAAYMLLLALGHAQVAVWIAWLLFGPTPLAGRVILALIGLVGVQFQLVADTAGFTGVLLVMLLLKGRARHHAWQQAQTTESSLDRTRQFSLQDILLWMTTTGVGLALLNCLRADGSDVRTLLVATSCSMIATLLMTLATLDERTSIAKVGGSVAIVLAIVASLTIGQPAINRLLWIERATVECALLLASMLVLRVAGLRLWHNTTDTSAVREGSPAAAIFGTDASALRESKA